MKRLNNNFNQKQYVITATTGGKLLVFLGIDDNNESFWTRNISKAAIWTDDIDSIYAECMNYVQNAIESTKEVIQYTSLMLQRIDHTLFPIDALMFIPVPNTGIENLSVNEIVNSGESYLGRDIEMWCIKNMGNTDPSDDITKPVASLLYNKYFNRELFDESKCIYPPNSKVYYYIIRDENLNYYLHRDYNKSGTSTRYKNR